MLTLVATSPLAPLARSEEELPQMLASIGNCSRIEGEAQAQFKTPTLSPLRWPSASLTPCSGRNTKVWVMNEKLIKMYKYFLMICYLYRDIYLTYHFNIFMIVINQLKNDLIFTHFLNLVCI